MNCNVKMSSLFLSFGDFNNCNTILSVVNKFALKCLNRENYLKLSFAVNDAVYHHVFFMLHEYAD